jgi:hypothetical protein
LRARRTSATANGMYGYGALGLIVTIILVIVLLRLLGVV